jgi:serine phosphatase RsbU (regulator of sigma subunit)
VTLRLYSARLAVFGFASYSTAVHKLEADDRIVLYTDGVVDASNAAGDFFGHDALCDLLTRTRAIPRDGSRLDHFFSPPMVGKAG